MAGRVFKLVSLIGGGVLAFGGGALGTYFAQPYLESKFNPGRKQSEEKLDQSFQEKSSEVDYLGNELMKFQKENEDQNRNISSLTKDLSGLQKTVFEKQAQIDQKINEIAEKQQKLTEKEEEYKQQSEQITTLTKNLQIKTDEVTSIKNQKTKIQDELDYVKKRLALTSEDILTDVSLKKRSTKTSLRKIEWKKSEEGRTSTFEVEKYSGGTKQIKIKRSEKFPNREEKALEIKTKGITFDLDSTFKSWKKVVKVTTYDMDYDYNPTDSSKKKNFSKNENTREIQMSEYFKPDYFEEAFKVFIAIGQLENSFMCHNTESTEKDKPYLFCENSDSVQRFDSEGGAIKWNEFTSQDESSNKVFIWTNRFVTIDDFINYWTSKTVELTRTGTVDLFSFLNPMLLSKNYSGS